MKATLAIMARDLISWRESKTAVLAILMHVLGVSQLEISESDLGCTLEMNPTKAVKSMETILNYFRKNYEGTPLSVSLLVRHGQEQ